MVFISVVDCLLDRPNFQKFLNGFDNGTFSPSSIVCGKGFDIVSGKNKLAIPPSVSKHPIIINGNTSILLPYDQQKKCVKINITQNILVTLSD